MKKTGMREIILLLLSAVLMYAILKKPDIAIGYVRSGLKLCGERVIPSLFPFAVLSSLFVNMGGADLLGRGVGGPVSRLFGISRTAAFVPIAGMLCGFPVGAMAASGLYRRGDITRGELQRLLVISGVPGSAFLISTVGISVWSSRAFGIALYVIQIISVTVIGVVLKYLYPPSVHRADGKQIKEKRDGVTVFCDCVGDSAYSMLKICGFVSFFVSCVGTLCSVLEDWGLPPLLKIPIMGFFEMTGAVAQAPQLGEWGAVLTALFVGWSGLSVHFQIFSVCRDISVSMRGYFAAKAVQGVLSALLAYFYVKLSGCELRIPSTPVFNEVRMSTAVLFSGLLILSLLLPLLRKKFL